MNKSDANKKCICAGCPSYVNCKESIAFCFTGKSKCIKEEKGCICGSCPVHKEMKFRKGYYCTKGKE